MNDESRVNLGILLSFLVTEKISCFHHSISLHAPGSTLESSILFGIAVWTMTGVGILG